MGVQPLLSPQDNLIELLRLWRAFQLRLALPLLNPENGVVRVAVDGLVVQPLIPAERQEIARIVGMGALKYFILKVDARKNMLFNPEESIDFNGNTGPFIQYTYARIRSILRKAEAEGLKPAITAVALSEKEVELIQKMNEFGAAVEQAGKDYSPSGIANYCYELTKVFNQFYHDYSILNEPDEQKKLFRLALAKNVAKIIKNGMGLLGIEVPERM